VLGHGLLSTHQFESVAAMGPHPPQLGNWRISADTRTLIEECEATRREYQAATECMRDTLHRAQARLDEVKREMALISDHVQALLSR
jgi:hypothetical protein